MAGIFTVVFVGKSEEQCLTHSRHSLYFLLQYLLILYIRVLFQVLYILPTTLEGRLNKPIYK
jgi:hypothetical protein